MHPQRAAFTFLPDDESGEVSFTYEELDRKARAIAAFLQDNGLRGERAVLLLPSGLEYIAAFFGCLLAGVIAVPGFPVHFGRQRKGNPWFRAIAEDARPKIAFALPELIKRASAEAQNEPGIAMLRWVNPRSIEDAHCQDWKRFEFDPHAIAFLQYTSGSTSAPKGVMVTHSNILENQAVIQAACGTNQESTIVSWLPFFHDMGLIGTILQPVYLGARSVLMSPTRFLQNPVSWLRAITKYQGHSSTGPNFAYDLCSRKITAQEKAELNLSSWRVAVNGAEPVRPDTLERFASSFSDCGFRPEAFFPSYGLAESTLMVTGSRSSGFPRTLRVSNPALEQNTVQEAAEQKEGGARVLVGCGSPSPRQEVKIVDPEKLEPCGERAVGEIWVKGPSVAQGYWNKPEETAHTFRAQLKSGGEGTFLRTGDLGFLWEGQLFITGRIKDLIILRGRNLYPQDIELTVQRCDPSLQNGIGAAFIIAVDGEDALVVIGELQRHAAVNPEALLPRIREAVLLDHGIQTYAVALTKSGAIPKTTSGKIRRGECRDLYLRRPEPGQP
jgi:acyl-CoA synthetase (AMP-forming)/AMP-acid ligase II